MVNNDYMKCICCNKEQEVLISTEMKSTSVFSHRRGVCQVCLKNKDINKVCEEFEISKTEESIEDLEMSLKGLQKNLKELKGSHKQKEGGRR